MECESPAASSPAGWPLLGAQSCPPFLSLPQAEPELSRGGGRGTHSESCFVRGPTPSGDYPMETERRLASLGAAPGWLRLPATWQE